MIHQVDRTRKIRSFDQTHYPPQQKHAPNKDASMPTSNLHIGKLSMAAQAHSLTKGKTLKAN